MSEVTTTTLSVLGVEVPNVQTQLFIGGQWRDASDEATFDVIAPASEERIATVAAASSADVDAAVAAARAQFDGGDWSQLTGADRGRLLYRLADLIERDLEIFVTLEALDIGRPRSSRALSTYRTRSTSSVTSQAGPTRSKDGG